MRRQFIAVLVTTLLVLGLPARVSAQTPAEQFDGRPTFKEGKALGYFIWREGDTWKLRWMTFGAENKFMGRVVVEGGDLVSFKRVDVDEERKVIRPGVRPGTVRGPRGRVIGTRPGRAPVVAEKTLDNIEQQDEKTLQWLTQTDDDIDGVDFKVSASATAIRFMLQINGEPKPAEIEIGKANFKPNQLPLRAVLKVDPEND
jgi:hypothetical protein